MFSNWLYWKPSNPLDANLKMTPHGIDYTTSLEIKEVKNSGSRGYHGPLTMETMLSFIHTD